MSSRTIYMHKYSITSSVSTSCILIGERENFGPWITNVVYAYVFDELGKENHKNPRMRKLYNAILDRIHLSNVHKMHFGEKDDELDINISVRLESYSKFKEYDGSDMGLFQEKMIRETYMSSFWYQKWESSQNTNLPRGDENSELTEIVFRSY
jgi:hypothetical protein